MENEPAEIKQAIFNLYSDVGEDDRKSPSLVKYKPLSISMQKHHIVGKGSSRLSWRKLSKVLKMESKTDWRLMSVQGLVFWYTVSSHRWQDNLETIGSKYAPDSVHTTTSLTQYSQNLTCTSSRVVEYGKWQLGLTFVSHSTTKAKWCLGENGRLLWGLENWTDPSLILSNCSSRKMPSR